MLDKRKNIIYPLGKMKFWVSFFKLVFSLLVISEPPSPNLNQQDLVKFFFFEIFLVFIFYLEY